MSTEKISSVQPHISSMGCSVVPTSFDPTDPNLQGFPRPLEWEWTSCEEAMKRYSVTGVLVRIPLFWQVLSPIHRACVKARCGLFPNEQENSPIGEAAARLAGIDMVITNAKDAFGFSLFLVEKNTKIPSWLIVHEPTHDWDIPIPLEESSIKVTQEVHLFPGLPLLTQCKALSETKQPLFHASSECMVEIKEEHVLVSSKGNPPLSLTEYRLDISLESRGTCSCGEEIIANRA